MVYIATYKVKKMKGCYLTFNIEAPDKKAAKKIAKMETPKRHKLIEVTEHSRPF